MYSCRSIEWPFWFGFIAPFTALYLFDWIMFVVILMSILRNKNSDKQLKSNESSTRLYKKSLFIALSMAVVFGLGWGFGLLTTSSSIEGLTITFQVIFSIFVGSQGVLLFLLHGVRNPDVRAVWNGWWRSLTNITKPSSVIFSSKNTFPHSMNGSLRSSGSSTLQRTQDEKKEPDLVIKVEDSPKN